MRKKILLLGSGELGKELVIALQRLGQYVIAGGRWLQNRGFLSCKRVPFPPANMIASDITKTFFVLQVHK